MTDKKAGNGSMKANLARWSTIAIISFASVASGTGASYATPLGGLTRAVPQRPGIHMVARRDTIPPFAFARFCAQRSEECEKRGSEKIVELSREKRAFLQRINVEINNAMRYVAEDANDDWTVGGSTGDCEDFALTKRKRLLDAGWPSGALRIATARTAEGIGHAVLVVSTSAGDLVLDNRTNTVKPWFATQFRWIKIQSSEDPRRWVAL